MTESKQIQQVVLSEESEEFDRLLDNSELLDKTSIIYDLKKISGASNSDSEESNDIPGRVNEKSIQITPEESDEDDNASQQSEEGYLPTSLFNTSQTFDTRGLCKSPPIAKNKRKLVRRIKSDKTNNRDGDNDAIAESFHSLPCLSPTEQELELLCKSDGLIESFHSLPCKSPAEQELERLCKSEELKKPESSKSETSRQKSEDQLRRPPLSSRREKGRSRKPKESNESTGEKPSKSSSTRRSKDKSPRSRSKNTKSKGTLSVDKQVVEWKRTSKTPPRSRSKTTKPASKSSDTIPVDKQVVEWKRANKSEEEQPLLKQRKPKKSKSAPSNAVKSKRSKPESRSLSRSRVPKSTKQLTAPTETTKDKKVEAVDRKGSTTHQSQRKKSQKQNPTEVKQPKQKSGKSKESPNDKAQKNRTRRVLTKAKSSSCRELLRKIDKMNDDRIKQNEIEKELENVETTEEKQETVDELSRSTNSANLDISRSTVATSLSLTDLEDTNHSRYSSIKPQEEGAKIPRLPPRTRSTPLQKVRKEKISDTKASAFEMSSSSLLSVLSFSKKEKTNGSSETKSMKKSLSDQLQKFGKKAKGTGNGEEKTERTGNRSESIQRSKSESSLGLGTFKAQIGKKRASTSQYDLMLSLHSDKDYGDCESDSDNDDNSFTGEELDKVEEDQNVLETSVKSLSPSDLFEKEEETVDKAHKSKNSKFVESSQKSKTFKLSESFRKLKTSKLNESFQRSKTFKFNQSFQRSKTFKFNESSKQSNTFQFDENCKHHETNTEACDDILPMAEFSEHTITPKKPSSCLQIDFSQLSEHGSSGNIIVRAKKLGKRANGGSRELRTSHSSAVKV